MQTITHLFFHIFISCRDSNKKWWWHQPVSGMASWLCRCIVVNYCCERRSLQRLECQPDSSSARFTWFYFFLLVSTIFSFSGLHSTVNVHSNSCYSLFFFEMPCSTCMWKSSMFQFCTETSSNNNFDWPIYCCRATVNRLSNMAVANTTAVLCWAVLGCVCIGRG